MGKYHKKPNSSDSENEKLHIEDKYTKHRPWTIWNIDLSAAILRKCRLNTIELCIFQEIAMNYNANYQEPYEIRHEELAKTWGCKKPMISKCIKKLTDEKLILLVNDRKGRAISRYVPNVKYLKALLYGYLLEIGLIKEERVDLVKRLSVRSQ